MADEPRRKPEPEISAPPPVPPTRAARPDPGVIDGEATEIHDESSPPPAAAAAQEPAPEAAQATGGAPPRLGAFPLGAFRLADLPPTAVAAGLGALVGAALALAVILLVDPHGGALRRLRASLAAQSASVATLDQRLAALENGASGVAKADALDALGRRVAGLEAANAGDAAKAALADARVAQADAAKALELAQRPVPPPVATDASAESGALAPRLDGLEARLAKLEGASSAAKTEARLAATENDAADDAPAFAILALSLDERFVAGAPYDSELAALAKRDLDAAALAALKPYADSGAPTAEVIAASWALAEPRVAAAVAPPPQSGWDRLLDHMRALVRVRRVGAAPGADDPDSRLRTIGAALTLGDVGGALAAFAQLPEAARAAGADWAKAAAARQAAATAAAALRADALARLTATKD